MGRRVLGACPPEKTRACHGPWRAAATPATRRAAGGVGTGIARRWVRGRPWRPGPARAHADAMPGWWKRTSSSASIPHLDASFENPEYKPVFMRGHAVSVSVTAQYLYMLRF